MINSNKPNNDQHNTNEILSKTILNNHSKIKRQKVISCIKYALIATTILSISSEALAINYEALAYGFFDPLKKAAAKYWHYPVYLATVAGVVVSEGENKAKAIRAVVGLALAAGACTVADMAFIDPPAPAMGQQG